MSYGRNLDPMFRAAQKRREAETPQEIVELGEQWRKAWADFGQAAAAAPSPYKEDRSMSDTEILDWIEEHVDDVTVFRDFGQGDKVKWEVAACADESGCQTEAKQPTLRKTIEMLAMRPRRGLEEQLKGARNDAD